MTANFAMAVCANRDARAAVALACRIHGKQRGWHLAAEALGISDRTARAIERGDTTGATIPPDRAHAALMGFRRQRAAMIREELAALEGEDLDMHGRAMRLAG